MSLNNARHPHHYAPSPDITELGRTARVYSEVASRTEPTLSDVQLALVDAGKSSPHPLPVPRAGSGFTVTALPGSPQLFVTVQYVAESH